MSVTLDERAREASDALLAAAELRPRSEPLPSPRATLRVAVTAAVVVVAVSVGAVIAFRGSSPAPTADSAGRSTSAQHVTGRYRASAVLVSNAIAPSGNRALAQDARLLTIGLVPSRAAEALHFEGDPARLAEAVHVVIDQKAGTITITSVQPTADRGRSVVNTFGEQLVGYLAEVATLDQRIQISSALQRQVTLEQEFLLIVAQLKAVKAAGGHDPLLEAKRTSLVDQIPKAAGDYQVLLRKVPTARYRLIEASRAVSVAARTTSHSKRAVGLLVAVALVAGLLLVATLAIAFDRRRGARRGTTA